MFEEKVLTLRRNPFHVNDDIVVGRISIPTALTSFNPPTPPSLLSRTVVLVLFLSSRCVGEWCKQVLFVVFNKQSNVAVLQLSSCSH